MKKLELLECFEEKLCDFISICKKSFVKSIKMMANRDQRSEPEITITAAEANVKSSLIVVSNRLPFVLKKNADGSYYRQAR